MSLFISSSRSEPSAINLQIAGKPLKIFQPSENGNILVAQVMTRGMVKSKFMYKRKWVIRSQPPYIVYKKKVLKVSIRSFVQNSFVAKLSFYKGTGNWNIN